MSNTSQKTPIKYSDRDRARWHIQAQRALKRVRARDAAARAKREARRSNANFQNPAAVLTGQQVAENLKIENLEKQVSPVIRKSPTVLFPTPQGETDPPTTRI
jgi:hypothetical protein